MPQSGPRSAHERLFSQHTTSLRLQSDTLFFAREICLLRTGAFLVKVIIGISAHDAHLRIVCPSDPAEGGGSLLLAPGRQGWSFLPAAHGATAQGEPR